MTTGKVSSLVNRRMLPFVMALGLGAPCLELFMLAASPEVAADSAVLKLRRLGDRVDVVVDGVTTDARVVSESSSATQWSGQLRAAAPLLLRRSQEVDLSEAGLQSIRLSASGTGGLQLTVRAAQGTSLPEPKIQVDGTSLIVSFTRLPIQTTALTSGQLDLSRPGRVQQSAFSPPVRARASAPPLGDMAVGTMLLQNRSYVNLSGPPVSLTLNNAAAKDTLMSLAKLGGYGFVFVGNTLAEARSAKENADETLSRSLYPVTLQFFEEDYSRAVNSVLLASGLQGRLEGKMLLVGENVSSKGFGPNLSKTYRLNSVSALSAAMFLGSLGAKISQVTTVRSVDEGESGKQGIGTDSTRKLELKESGDLGFVDSIAGRRSSSFRSNLTQIDTYGASEGPLKGLTGTTDSRLQTITLIGDSQLVDVAASYLKKIDLRQRQVALSVRILDVTLDNDSSIQNDFAFRYGNNFIVSDSGRFSASFGELLPPNSNNFDVIAGGASSGKPETVTVSGDSAAVQTQVIPPSAIPGRINPGLVYPKDRIFEYLSAAISSGSAKTLASPTMILSENPEPVPGGVEGQSLQQGLESTGIGRPYSNESYVAVGTNEITNYSVESGQNGAANTCQPIFGISGLTVGARVKKIDDNGFVTFTLSPAISATTSTQDVQGCGPISVLSLRRLDTGTVRVRDGQTLILTGVISDSDVQAVSKWPILGDIPLIGQFFRSSAGRRNKRELVILVSPRILDDEESTYGYGYRPSTKEARRLMGAS